MSRQRALQCLCGKLLAAESSVTHVATANIFQASRRTVHAATTPGLLSSALGTNALQSHVPAPQWTHPASHLQWHQRALRQFQSTPHCQADVEIAVPSMGDSISEGVISDLHKQVGDVVKTDDVIAQIETDKITIDVQHTGSKPGVLTALSVNKDDTVTVGQTVCTIDDDEGKVKEAGGAGGADNKESAAKSEKQEEKPAEAAPAQKEEKKAEAPKQEAPSKPAQESKPAPQQPSKGGGAAEQSTPSPPVSKSSERPERRVKMTQLRQRVAARLKGAQNTYAMLSTFNEVDMTNVMAMRAQYKDTFLERHGVKLGFMSVFVKAAASALEQLPAVNAVIDDKEIIYRDYVDVSIAVATPKGLVVPVLRNVESMRFADVETTLVGLGKKARDRTLSIDEMSGGTFTISNGGVYGSMLSTPIINPPQSAIMGMHSIIQRPMVVEGKIEARPMMNIALTYDHRLIDGREAVMFLRRVKDVVEDPRRLLLDI